jgi:hypothetical protein
MFVPPRSSNMEEAMLKSFIQTIVSYNIMEILVLTSQGKTVLLDGSMSQ